MRYILSGLITVAGEILGDIMGFFTGSFWKELGITTKGNGLVENIQHPATGGVFDAWLPGAKEAYTAFAAIGLFIVLLLMIMGLLKAFLPNSLAEAEHPFTVIARSAGAAVAVAYAALIVCLFQQPMGELYQAIFDASTTGGHSMSDSFTDNDAKSVWVALIPGNNSVPFASEEQTLLETLGGSLLSIVFLFAIALNFLKLVLEMVERYITTCFLFYVSPLAFSTIASKSTQSIAASFIRMLFAQYLLIIFNCIFLFVFIWSYSHVTTDLKNYQIDNMTTLLIFYAVMLAWLKLGQRLDEHMNTLGLGAARTGAGLMGDIMAAGYTTIAAGKALGGAVKLGANATKAMGRTEMGSAAAARFGETKAGKAVGVVGSVGTGVKNMATGNAPGKTMDQAINGTLHTGGAAAESIANNKLGAVGAAMNAPQVGGGRISDDTFSFAQGPNLSKGASISTIGSDGQIWSSSVNSYNDLKQSVAQNAIGAGNANVQGALDELGMSSNRDMAVAGLHIGAINGQDCAIYDSEVFSRTALESHLPSGSKVESIALGGRTGYKVTGVNASEADNYGSKAFRGVENNFTD